MEKISPPPRDDEDEYILLEEVEEVVTTVERPRRKWISDTTLVFAKEKRKANETEMYQRT